MNLLELVNVVERLDMAGRDIRKAQPVERVQRGALVLQILH